MHYIGNGSFIGDDKLDSDAWHEIKPTDRVRLAEF